VHADHELDVEVGADLARERPLTQVFAERAGGRADHAEQQLGEVRIGVGHHGGDRASPDHVIDRVPSVAEHPAHGVLCGEPRGDGNGGGGRRHRGCQQRVPVGETAVDGGLGDTRRCGDGFDTHASRSPAAQQVQRRPRDARIHVAPAQSGGVDGPTGVDPGHRFFHLTSL